jgi:WD40 repeat protein
LREPRFHEAVLQLAATLHNRPKDELDGADIRMQRQTRLLAVSGAIAIVVIALFALGETLLGRRETLQKLAARLAANSATVLTDSPDRAREAALLAIESNRLSPSFDGNQALRAAVSILPASVQTYSLQGPSPDGRVRNLAFSTDGAILAVARDDGSTQVLDVVNQKPLGFFTPDEQPAAQIELPAAAQSADLSNNSAVSVAFNSSNSMLASGARDGVVHVWALPGARELLRIDHGTAVSQVAFHPKTNQLATASDDGHVRIFDVASAAIVADFKCSDKMVSTSFSPSGDFLAALSSEGEVWLFDSVHRRLLRRFGGSQAGFNLAFSSSGRRLAISGGDFAFVWDISTGQQLLKATHAASSETLNTQQWIYNAAISADGKFLAYAARGDSLARIWNVDTGRQILELKHDSAVAAASFNADGTKLGTGSYDGTARVWELPSGRELERASLSGGAETVSFSPASGRFAAGGVDGSVLVSETRRADRPAYFEVHADVHSVAFSPDGQRIAIGTRSAHNYSLVKIADIHGKNLTDIEFKGAPVLDKLLFLDPNNLIALWSNKVFRIAVDRSSTTPLPDLPPGFRISASGQVLAVQQDGVSRLYTFPGLQQTATLDVPSSSRLGAVGPEGKLLAFEASQPPSQFFVDIWNVPGNNRISRILLPAELTRGAFNSSATTLFTAQSENLQAWDIPSAKQRFSITTSGDIDLIVSDPSSAAFATLTHGHLTVWDAATGARLAQLPDAGYVRAVTFSPDGRYLLTGYDEGSAALWLWRSDDLRDQACARLTANFSHQEWKRWLPDQPYRPICPNLLAAK